MASGSSGVTAQSVLGKISRDHLECSICSNRFRKPKLLDCLHSFCLECLQEYRRHQGPQDVKLACPLCRCETVLKGDISDLPHNFTMSALVDEVNVQEQLLEGQGSKIKCQACEEEHIAVSRCMDCDHFLCEECQRAHGRMKMMKSHEIYTLAQLHSGEVTYKSKLREYTPKCSKHPDQSVNIYCITCEQLACTTCAILTHKNHSYNDLPEALGKCKQNVKVLVAKAEKNKMELSIFTSEVEDDKKKLDMMYAGTTEKISRQANKAIANIRKEEENLKQELDTIYNDRVKKFNTALATNREHINQTERELDELKQFMTQASSHEILDFQQKLLHKLKESAGRQAEKVPLKMPLMDFVEGDERSLGRLVPEQEKTTASDATAAGSKKPVKWEFMTEIKTFRLPQRELKIAAFSNNEIVILDAKHKKVISLLLNSKCQSIVPPDDLQLEGLSNPSHISVNKDNQLIVLDPPTVKIFNWGHQSCLHQFNPGGNSPSKPSCLAVGDNNLIAVGHRQREKITLHNPDGSLIKTIPAPMIGRHLRAYKQKFIYTSFQENNLLSVDDRGGMVFSVDITTITYGLCDVYGLWCDSEGSIYVIVNGWQQGMQGKIHHFNPNGEYMGCAVDNCGQAGDVIIAPSGHMLVAARDSVKVYQCQRV